jgi:anti-sigma B factor antagonist
MSLQSPPHFFRTECTDGATWVRFIEKNLNDSNIDLIGDELYDLVDAQGHRALHLDFAAVQSLTSLGLGKLIALHKKLRAVGGRLSVRNVSPGIYEAFDITRLNRLFDVQRTGWHIGAA